MLEIIYEAYNGLVSYVDLWSDGGSRDEEDPIDV